MNNSRQVNTLQRSPMVRLIVPNNLNVQNWHTDILAQSFTATAGTVQGQRKSLFRLASLILSQLEYR